MRVLRLYITGSSPVTCTKLKTRMKSRKLRFHAGFSLFFSQKYFYVLKLIFTELSHFLSKCNTICNTLITYLLNRDFKNLEKY